MIRSFAKRASIVVATVLVAGALMAASSMFAHSAETVQVQAAAARAVHADHELGTLPAEAANTGFDLTNARAVLTARATRELHDTFAGAALNARLDVVLANIALDGTPDGIFVWGGGVSDLTFQSTVITGPRAVVKLRATTFMILSPTAAAQRSRPEGTDDYTLGLVNIGGIWKVESLVLEPLPGQGP